MNINMRGITFSFASVLGLGLLATACGDDGGSATPDAPPVAVDAAVAPAITLSTAGTLGARLVDKDGKSLYFFANDVAGSNASFCTANAAACAAWPTFSVASPTVGEGLVAADFGSIDRGGGVSQTTWKGRPLYYYSMDSAAEPTKGEGTGGRWFVARAYNVFFAANATVTPTGGAANAPFLTSGAGRTVYAHDTDTRGAGAAPPVSACTGACATTWPLWDKAAAVTTVVVPSTIPAADVTTFAADGKQQFAYKGWPLYFYGADDAPGKVAGAAIATWHPLNVAFTGTF